MHRSPQFQAATSQPDELTTQHSFCELQENPRPSRKTRLATSFRQRVLVRMECIIAKKLRNKKCYSMQVLKQFLLFPDSSLASSCLSVSRYDPLLFSDEKLHSVLKIMETQLIARKIWAFINLKANRKRENIRYGVQACSEVTKRVTFFQKQESFSLIKRAGKKMQSNASLSSHSMINIMVTCAVPKGPVSEISQKFTKLQVNTSKRTMAESEREATMYCRRERSEQSICQSCCCSCCCCCGGGENLWQRIQYMRYLQSLLSRRERSGTFEQG